MSKNEVVYQCISTEVNCALVAENDVILVVAETVSRAIIVIIKGFVCLGEIS